ncbi:BnaA09g12450D [Brassica napus]|nr:unnamed protein product [Brassica napus]CDY45360.1 BnaA09g12450D [Brassica napus]
MMRKLSKSFKEMLLGRVTELCKKLPWRNETMKTVKLTLLLLKHNIDLFWKTQFYN